jgi:hypothetical protein
MKIKDYCLFVYKNPDNKWQAEVQDIDGYPVFTAVSPLAGEVIAAGAIALDDWNHRDDDTEDCLTHPQCGACNGSGEGMYPGTICPSCKGLGETNGR